MADDMEDIEDMLEAPYKHSTSNDGGEHGKKNGSSKLENGHDEKMNVDEKSEDVSNHKSKDENGSGGANGSGEDNKNDTAASESGNEVKKKHENKETSSKSKDRKEKSSRKDRSRSRSKERDRRSRSGSRSKHSKRSRSKDKDREKRRRTKSRERDVSDRDKDKSRDKDRDRDRDRKRTRSRSRSHKRRTRSRSRSHKRRTRTRTRSRSRGDDRRRRHSSRGRTRSRTPVKREKTPELTPEERDQRTVFCMQLSARIRPRDLEEFFSAVGKVRDVRLITDPRTKRSKGIAYIEFKDTESVPLAIALTGQRLLGVPIIVKLTQAEKNRLPFTGPHIPANLPQTGPIKLYVGSLHQNITEEMLQGIFEPFGPIDAIVLARDDFGRSKGYGFIQFSSADDGKKAIEQLNNFDLAGRPIKVSLFISEKAFDVPTTTGSTVLPNLDNDELDRTGVNLGPSGKLALMAKLAEGTGLKLPQQTLDALNMSSTAVPVVNQNGPVPTVTAPVATQCFLLSNMFDLEEEKQKPDWMVEIQDDVIQECNKYGGVVHISIDQNAPEGNIYIKCPTIAIAMAAMSGLNGRYFAGKMIQASFIPIATYHQKFPESAACVQLLKPSE